VKFMKRFKGDANFYKSLETSALGIIDVNMLYLTRVTDNSNMANGRIISGVLLIVVNVKESVCLIATPYSAKGVKESRILNLGTTWI
jgi:hypothetical protein